MTRGRKLPKVLTEDEQAQLLAQFNLRYPASHRNWLLIKLALATGLRSAEIRSLKLKHVNMLTGKLMVREGKGAKDRTLWISQDLIEDIETWLERRPESEYLFPTRDGNRLGGRNLRQMISTYAERAAIQEAERVSPHTLRHTFATDLYRETKNIRLVQKALGHSDLSTTMIYTHIVDDELEGALKGFRS